MRGPMSVVLMASMLVAAGACGGNENTGPDQDTLDCATDGRAPAFELGMTATGEAGYSVTLGDAVPNPAARDDNEWTIDVLDPSQAPADGLTIDVQPFMPDHGHGTSIPANVTEADPGTYDIDPINLWMPGYWEITMTLSDADDNELDSVMLSVCIDP